VDGLLEFFVLGVDVEGDFAHVRDGFEEAVFGADADFVTFGDADFGIDLEVDVEEEVGAHAAALDGVDGAHAFGGFGDFAQVALFFHGHGSVYQLLDVVPGQVPADLGDDDRDTAGGDGVEPG